MTIPTTDLDILTRPFPPEAIKQREIARGFRASYVDGATVIRRLNEATGNHWDMTVDRYWEENGKTLALVTLRLPGLGSRQHIGVQASDGRSGEDAGAKGAITDALKKAATLFGVGLDLYGPDLEHAEQPERQVVTPTASGPLGQGPAPNVPRPPASAPNANARPPSSPKVDAANRLLSRESAAWTQQLQSDGQIVTDMGEMLGPVASEAQQKFVKSLVFKQWGGNFKALDAMTDFCFGCDLYALSKEQVSAVIDYMQASTTPWVDPRQLGGLLDNLENPAADPPARVTSPAEAGAATYQRIKGEAPTDADERNAAAWQTTMAQQAQRTAEADAEEAALETMLPSSLDPVEGFVPHAAAYDGEKAMAEFNEFRALLDAIQPGARASGTLSQLQTWMTEHGYRDNPKFQFAWAATIDRLNAKK